jgi:aspartate aminotransferase-like enzyme
MSNVGGAPYLLTPGPLTTSLTVKQAMLRDWGSRDRAFIELNARIRERLVRMAGAEETHSAFRSRAAAPSWSRQCLAPSCPGTDACWCW